RHTTAIYTLSLHDALPICCLRTWGSASRHCDRVRDAQSSPTRQLGRFISLPPRRRSSRAELTAHASLCRPARTQKTTRRSKRSARQSLPLGSNAMTLSWRLVEVLLAILRASLRLAFVAASTLYKCRRRFLRRSIPRSAARPESIRVRERI